MNHCHDCQFLRPANGSVRCGRGLKVKYKWPESSADLNYGFHAVGGCGSIFRERTSAYYEEASKRGPKSAEQSGDGQAAA